MSVIMGQLDPDTKKEENEIEDEYYNHHQAIARSGFADMLHDSERNKKYYIGIRCAVEKMHKLGKKANVLDIGTGTGLLSMMAVKSGADSVVACEAFLPMANCAMQIIKENGFSGKIKVFPKRSTELTVGDNGDMKQRANILVTEVFDTELIGEGAISIFNHAHKELLELDCLVVPSSSTMYAQVVQSALAQRWNKLDALVHDGRVLLDAPAAARSCPGSDAVHDIQLSQFAETEFQTIIAPVPVFRFDWSGRDPPPLDAASTLRLNAERDGIAQVVFMWWELAMDADAEVVLSCAPKWAHPDAHKADSIPWRDHWMQALYYLPHEVPVTRGEQLALTSCHDEYSLWFDLKKHADATQVAVARPACTCGVHRSFGHTCVGALNDASRRASYLAALREAGVGGARSACPRDGSLLPAAAVALGAERVFRVSRAGRTEGCCDVARAFLEGDGAAAAARMVDVGDAAEIGGDVDKISLVFGEPLSAHTLLPWQNTGFWYLKRAVEEQRRGKRVDRVMPASAVVWAMAVQFTDLWKIRAPLTSVEGFSVSPFDELIDASSDISDSPVEAQPLWEYPCFPLSDPVPVFHFDFGKDTEQEMATGRTGTQPLRRGLCHGFAIWVEWNLDGNGKHVVTTGPLERPAFGKKVAWDMHTRQGVSFLKRGQRVDEANTFTYSAEFVTVDGPDVKFCFELS